MSNMSSSHVGTETSSYTPHTNLNWADDDSNQAMHATARGWNGQISIQLACNDSTYIDRPVGGDNLNWINYLSKLKISICDNTKLHIILTIYN